MFGACPSGTEKKGTLLPGAPTPGRLHPAPAPLPFPLRPLHPPQGPALLGASLTPAQPPCQVYFGFYFFNPCVLVGLPVPLL